MSFISIIIPVYNAEQYLVQCLDSIRIQSYSDFEVILIDDGSTDNSGKICNNYEELDKRFHSIHQKNSGVAAARNTGIAISKGEYVTFIDSDDWIDPDYLYSFAVCIEKASNADAIVNSKYFVDDSREILWESLRDKNQILPSEAAELLISAQMPSSMWAYFYKRRVLNGLGVDSSIHFYEDLDFNLATTERGFVYAVNHRPGYHYRSGSVTHSVLEERTMTAFEMVDKQIQANTDKRLLILLESRILLSVSLVGAVDLKHRTIFDKRIKHRARMILMRYWRELSCLETATKTYICLLAIHPSLFYFLYRVKHHIKG